MALTAAVDAQKGPFYTSPSVRAVIPTILARIPKNERSEVIGDLQGRVRDGSGMEKYLQDRAALDKACTDVLAAAARAEGTRAVKSTPRVESAIVAAVPHSGAGTARPTVPQLDSIGTPNPLTGIISASSSTSATDGPGLSSRKTSDASAGPAFLPALAAAARAAAAPARGVVTGTVDAPNPLVAALRHSSAAAKPPASPSLR